MLKNNKNRLNYYAKILIFFSVILMLYGAFLDYNYNKKSLNPVYDIIKIKEEKNTVSISTADGGEVVPGNKIVNVVDKDTKKNKDNNKHTNGNKVNSEENNEENNEENISTIDKINETLCKELEDLYEIDIKYGKETLGYEVGGFTTTPINDSNNINSALIRLKNIFKLYPNDFFKEIKNGGIPLTVILINNYSDNSITGVTDSSFDYADISIALEHSIEDSFYHESYHYIERYIFKKGANFNSWNSLNPIGYNYGIINKDYSYDNTFMENVPFVNNYAQTSDAEDRASTFEYMMAESKASCLNSGNIVWKKANLIKNTIEVVFKSVSPSTTEYWERFI